MSIIKSSGAGEVSTGFYNDVIGQSLRFDDDDNSRLSTTWGSAGNRKIWTLSWWMKRTTLGEKTIFSSPKSSSENGFTVYFPDDKLEIFEYKNTSRTSTFGATTDVLFRDITNWYHCVIYWQTDTYSSDADSVRLYVNGSQVNLTFRNDGVGADYESVWWNNSSYTQYIGGQRADSQNFDGYIAEVNFIDGQALTPSNFGETKNGVWIPKKYTGSYGTNGFRFTFADSTDIGNNANSTDGTNDFSVTNLVGTDVVLDNPENNFCTLNPLNTNDNRGQASFSRNNLRMTSGSTDRGFTTGTMKLQGKVYFEVLCRDHNSGFVGINNIDNTVHSGKGQSVDFYLGTPRIDNSILSNTGTFDDNDIMGVAVDVDAKSIEFFNNNSSILDTTYSTDAEYFPYLYDSSGGRQMDAVANFGQDSSFGGHFTSGSAEAQDSNGQGDFYYTPPSGFLALCNANMPDTGFNADESDQPTAFHNVVTYSGTGNTTQNITGVGFQPDWVWIKNRNTDTVNHYILDSTRGLNYLSSNTTSAQSSSANRFNSFDSDGFQVEHSGGGNGFTNGSGQTYVAWNWKINGGTTTTDTTGTQDSIRQTNQTLGMTIGTHEATSGTYTFAHGLGATPEFLMFRNIDGTDNWVYWHTGMAAAGTTLQYINSTVANSNSGSNWLSTLNSTLIGITTGQVSGTSGTHLFWAFRSIEGFSKFGNYTGNANADGPLIFTGFRPSLIWIKNYSTGNTDHLIYDDQRHKSSNAGNPREYHLITNSTDDTQDLYDIDFLSNGFKIRHGDVNNINAGDTYLYWAWAHNPFKFSNAF